MTLAADEFIRRFLPHVLPQGFQRVRQYGFVAAPTIRNLSAGGEINYSWWWCSRGDNHRLGHRK